MLILKHQVAVKRLSGFRGISYCRVDSNRGDKMIVVDRLGNVQTNGEGQNNLLKKLYGTFLGRCALKIFVCRSLLVI